MGALDKRIFSGVAILSTLLFVVSAVMLLANSGEITDDANDIALYIVTVAGVLAVVYSVTLMTDRSSFVRTMSGVFTAIAGIMFFAVPFVGESTGVLLAVASVVAAVAIVTDMLALWVSRIYGAMYVAAVLAAVDLAMGVIYFADSPQTSYHAIALIAFGIWLALSAYVTGFVKVESVSKVREVKEDKQSGKSTKPQAKNTKATKKAKKPEKKPEARAVEQSDREIQKVSPKGESKEKEEPKEAPKEMPKQEPKKEEPKVDERPKQRPASRPVTLPNRAKAEEPKEAPKEMPKQEPKKEEPKTVESADGQKPPAKSMNDFMKKLMSSENANRAKHDAPTPKEPLKEEPEVVKPATDAVVEPSENEPVPDAAAIGSDVPGVKEDEESIVEEPEVLADELGGAPEAEAIVEEPVIETPTEEQETMSEAVEEPYEAVSEADVASVEESETKIEEPATEDNEVPGSETGFESEAEPQPDWFMVSHDAAQADESEESIEEPSDYEPETDEVVEVTDDQEPEQDDILAETPTEERETVSEIVELPDDSDLMPQSSVVEQSIPESEPVTGSMDVETGEVMEVGEEALGEDLYTDYSPEAVVRRAAWNKGLRCRRGYGPHNIPVAFVKGKVAVFVDDGDADTSTDSVLRDQGWTVLRYDAATITDGKAQGDEIAAAVKSNLRSAKAAAKKKSKK